MPHLTVAAIQAAAHDRGSFSRRWPQIARQISGAIARDAQLIVLPEGTIPGYVLGSQELRGGETETALRDCSELASTSGAVLVVGAARPEGERLFNSAIVFERDGSIAGVADKLFLWHFDGRWFAPGSRLQPIQTSIGNLGVLICADGRIPTLARALVDRGAEMLVMPTAWVTSGRDPHRLENVQADLLARIRALENRVPFVAANKVGAELGSVAYCGKSQIVATDGSVVAMASQRRPETLVARIEPARIRPQRAALPAPPAADIAERRSVRVAVSVARLGTPWEERLAFLDVQATIDRDGCANLPPHVTIHDDTQMHDPGFLAEYRLQGYDFVVWRPREAGWQEQFARARALELRIYVAVIDSASDRAYAVDPDGAVICGTFGDYRVAAFAYDPARTAQTAVAPHSDVLEGLRRVRVSA